MSTPATVRNYQQEIAELDGVLAMSSMDEASSLAIRVANAGLRHRRAALVAEMESAAAHALNSQQVDVILDGAPVVQNTIDAAFLAKTLNHVQKLVRYMLADRVGRLMKPIGRVGKSLEDLTALRLATTFPGSFGMRLEAGGEQMLFHDANPVGDSLESLLELMSATPDNTAFLEAFDPLSERSKGAYRSLLKDLARNRANMRVVWPTAGGVRQSYLRGTQARERYTLLKKYEESSRIEYRTGILDGIVGSTSRFELLLDDGQKISGSIEEHLLDTIADHWRKRCEARLAVRELFNNDGGEAKRTYTLSAIAPLS